MSKNTRTIINRRMSECIDRAPCGCSHLCLGRTFLIKVRSGTVANVYNSSRNGSNIAMSQITATAGLQSARLLPSPDIIRFHTDSRDASMRLDKQIRTVADDVACENLNWLRIGTFSCNRYIIPVDSDVPAVMVGLHGPQGKSTPTPRRPPVP
jgi:hypothetical protein